jgi:DNA-binding HxlR family transcriptional regulator
MTKPVDKYLQILGIIERENQTGVGVNQIIRKTGSTDKQRIINYIRDLEREKIIKTKSSSAHQQTKIKRLTNLGWDLTKLFHNLERYTHACSQLRQVNEEFYIPSGANNNTRNSMLRNRGWTSEEISNYDKIRQQTLLAEDIGSPSEVVNVILTKYILMLHKFTLKQNSIGKLILDKIIMDSVYAQFSIAAGDAVSSNSWLPREDLEFERRVLHDVFDSSYVVLSDKNVIGTSLMKVCLMDNPFDNRFISTKIRRILDSTYALLNVPNEIIDMQIRVFRNMAKDFENNDHILYKQIAGAFKELAAISEKAKNKSIE